MTQALNMSRDKILNTIVKSNASIQSNLNSQRIREKKSLTEVMKHFLKIKKYSVQDAVYHTTFQEVANFVEYIDQNTGGRVDVKFYGIDQLDKLNNLLTSYETNPFIARNLSEISKLQSGEIKNEKVSFWKGTNLEVSPLNYIDLIYNNGDNKSPIINLSIILQD